jgi:hypothetical protein
MSTEEKPFPLGRLIHRQTGVSDEEGVSVETSLYQSNVTGFYMIEQVFNGKGGEMRNAISLGPGVIAGLMPFLEKINRGDEV